MRLVFMGTPHLAATVLNQLQSCHTVAAVFTRPDAIRGRGKKLVPSPVKELAVQLGIPVFTTTTMNSDETAQQIAALKPDAICVAAYGCILPKRILDIPVYGCFNVHTSLLPRWRGAAPIERSILACDKQTGVCIMKMEEGLDTGPFCIQVHVPVEDKYLDDLVDDLAQAGAKALCEALEMAEEGRISWQEQGDDGVSYAKKIAKSELFLDPQDDAAYLEAKVRASNGSHPARMVIAGKSIAVLRAEIAQPEIFVPQGSAALVAKRLYIGASNGAVELVEVKPDGKKNMEGRAFAAGIQGIKNTQVTWGRV